MRTCEELFHHLLALDHQREQPWAFFHAINVACCVLQHPSTIKSSHLAAQRKLITAFCDDGLAGVHADGSFPGAGYAERAVVWAESVRAAWSEETRSG